MKRYLLLIILSGTAWLFGCVDSSSKKVGVESIRIIAVNQHAVLSEHCRKLLIQNKAGHVVDEETLYCAAGESCDAALFDTGATFTLIDCNDQGYIIQKSSGDLEKRPATSLAVAPEKYLGTYTWDDARQSYKFIPDQNTNSTKAQ